MGSTYAARQPAATAPASAGVSPTMRVSWGSTPRAPQAETNTACYGGGFRICPDADPTDGVLDILVGGRFTRTGVVRIMPYVRRGTHLGHTLVATHRARTVTLAAEGITAYADGERVGALPLTVTCVPAALTLLA